MMHLTLMIQFIQTTIAQIGGSFEKLTFLLRHNSEKFNLFCENFSLIYASNCSNTFKSIKSPLVWLNRVNLGNHEKESVLVIISRWRVLIRKFPYYLPTPFSVSVANLRRGSACPKFPQEGVGLPIFDAEGAVLEKFWQILEKSGLKWNENPFCQKIWIKPFSWHSKICPKFSKKAPTAPNFWGCA